MGQMFEEEESFSFIKNLVLSFLFFALTPLTIGISLFSLVSLSKADDTKKETVNLSYRRQLADSGVKVFASYPSDLPSFSAEVVAGDARPEIIKQYLEYWNSPLSPFSLLIVSTADKYGLDFRLITAIAQQESNLCKIIPPGSYNCWGWGIHSAGTLGFSSYQEGIVTVSEGIKKEYIEKGYKTVEEIMAKYTPLSNGSWAYGVNKFMAEMQ
jgi:hypothetical protein